VAYAEALGRGLTVAVDEGTTIGQIVERLIERHL